MITLAPDYLPSLRCKRGSCRRTCCRSDWAVALTADEYAAACASDPACRAALLPPDARGAALLPPDARGADSRCRTGPDGRCLLQSTDGLCAYRLRTGKHIGSVCRDFPVCTAAFPDRTYAFATAACEAVCEQLLGRTEPIALRPCASDAAALLRFTPDDLRRRELLGCYDTLLGFAVGLLQDRRFSLRARLYLLLHAFAAADSLEQQDLCDMIPETLARFSEPDNLSLLVARRQFAEVSPAAFLTAVCHICLQLLRETRTAPFARSVLTGLGFTVTEPEAGVWSAELTDVHAYLRRRARLDAHFASTEIYREHLCVTELQRSLAGLTHDGPFSSFAVFAAYVTLFNAAYFGCFDHVPTDGELVDLSVTLTRFYSHNAALTDAVPALLAAHDLLTPDGLTAMIFG